MNIVSSMSLPSFSLMISRRWELSSGLAALLFWSSGWTPVPLSRFSYSCWYPDLPESCALMPVSWQTRSPASTSFLSPPFLSEDGFWQYTEPQHLPIASLQPPIPTEPLTTKFHITEMVVIETPNAMIGENCLWFLQSPVYSHVDSKPGHQSSDIT